MDGTNDPIRPPWARQYTANRDDDAPPYNLNVAPFNGSSFVPPTWHSLADAHYVSHQVMTPNIPNPVMPLQEQPDIRADGSWHSETTNRVAFPPYNGSGSTFGPGVNEWFSSHPTIMPAPEFPGSQNLLWDSVGHQWSNNDLSVNQNTPTASQAPIEDAVTNWMRNPQPISDALPLSWPDDRNERRVKPIPPPRQLAFLSTGEIYRQYGGSMKCKLHLLLDANGYPSRTAESVSPNALCNAEMTAVGDLVRHLKEVHDITANHARQGNCCCAWPGCGKELKESSYLRHVLTHCICWVCPIRGCPKNLPRYEALVSHLEKYHSAEGLAEGFSSQYSYAVFKTALISSRSPF